MPAKRYLNAVLASGDVATVDLGQYDRMPYRARVTVAATIAAAEVGDATISVFSGSDVEVEDSPIQVAGTTGRAELPEDRLCSFLADVGEKVLVQFKASGAVAVNTIAAIVQIDWI